MGIDDFYNAFNKLSPVQGVPEEGSELRAMRNQLIRFLDSLGHCEFDFDTRRVYACRPSLVALPGRGLSRAVLTGARTPKLVNKMTEFVQSHEEVIAMSTRNQAFRSPFLGSDLSPEISLPQAIIFEAVNSGYLEELARSSNISYSLDTPAAWALVSCSAGLEEIRQTLVPKEFKGIKWQRREFSVEELMFRRSLDPLPETVLIEYRRRVDQQMRHVAKYGNKEFRIGRDWGRYLLLADNGRCIISYDGKRQQLLVPSTVPLPNLLARAAAMCSGFAPFQGRLDGLASSPISEVPVDIYRAVPEVVARQIASKLSQPLMHLDHLNSADLDVNND